MKTLISICASAAMFLSSAAIAAPSPCSGLSDDSFGCAAFLASETFFDVLGDVSEHDAIQACVDTFKGQASPIVIGSKQFNSDQVSLIISAKDKVVDCTAFNKDGKYPK